jgi:L-rhamnonate dehydratase
MMRITRVEPLVLRLAEVDTTRADGTQDAFLLRVHTDEGLVGIGEADTSPYLARTAIEMPSSHAIARGIAEVLLGLDPLQIDRVWQTLYRATSYYGRSALALHVISAVDIALWDIAGKAAGLPVSELLGGRRVEAVPVYASEVMPETPEAVREIAARAVDAGYGAFKLGWGPLGRDPGLDRELIASARETIGPARDLMIDGG